MYQKFSSPLPPESGPKYVGNKPKLIGPAEKGDTVTVRASEDTDFNILVEHLLSGKVQGEIVGIGPHPKYSYDGWSLGNKIEVLESDITGIVRGN